MRNLEYCRQCNAVLLFSARHIGDGLCHICGHKRVAAFDDLLAACEAALETLEHHPHGITTGLLREAIAKAKGQTT